MTDIARHREVDMGQLRLMLARMSEVTERRAARGTGIKAARFAICRWNDRQ